MALLRLRRFGSRIQESLSTIFLGLMCIVTALVAVGLFVGLCQQLAGMTVAGAAVAGSGVCLP